MESHKNKLNNVVKLIIINVSNCVAKDTNNTNGQLENQNDCNLGINMQNLQNINLCNILFEYFYNTTIFYKAAQMY